MIQSLLISRRGITFSAALEFGLDGSVSESPVIREDLSKSAVANFPDERATVGMVAVTCAASSRATVRRRRGPDTT